MTVDPSRNPPATEFNGSSAFSHTEEAWDVYRLLVENSYDLVGELDVNGNYVYVNPSYSGSLGFNQKQLISKNAFEFIHPQDAEKARQEFQQQDGTTILRFKHQNGAWKWFDCSFRQFNTPEGLRTVLISRDISARKEAEIKFEELASLGSKLSGAKTQVEAARVIAEAAQVLCEWDAFFLDLYDAGADLLLPILIVDEMNGRKTDIPPAAESFSPSPFLKSVLTTGPQRILRKGNDFDDQLSAFGDTSRASASLLFVPILEEGKPLGVVSIQSYRINAYSRSDLKLLQVLAGHCSGTLARIKAVDELRETQARFEAFMENTPGAAWIKNEGGKYVFANRSLEHLLSKKPEEVIDKTDADVLSGELARELQKEDLEVRKSGRPLRIEKNFSPEDARRWFLLKFPFFSPGGGSFVGGLAFDITDQVQMQRSLRASEERFRALFESAPVAIGLVDKGKLLYTNLSYRRMFHLPEENGISGRNILEDIAPGSRPEIARFFHDATLASIPPMEVKGVRGGGAEFPCILQVAPVQLSDGWAHLVFILDISEKRALEAQLFQAQKMESIGRLAGGIAHDFANLLTVIQGHASRLERGIPNPAPSLDGIIRAAQKATELTRQLLAFSRKQTLQLSDLDLNGVVGEISRMIDRLIGEDITLRLHLQDSLPLINADKTLVEQIILNLAVTARDAMTAGGNLAISTFYITPAEAVQTHSGWDRGAVCLRVEDTGRGMPPEDLPHIFEPFFRSKSGASMSLRLATVYGLVKQHNGHIDVKSRVASGTVFEISFPALSLPPQSVPAKTQPGARSGTVLVVEDSADLRILLRDLLRDEGYKILEASSFAAAVQLFEGAASEIGLVVADVCLEDGSGRELVKRIRKERPAIKAVLTTGYDPHQMREQIDLQSNERFLPKPFQSGELLDTVRSLMEG